MPASNPHPLATRWTRQRIARLGFLVGLGWDARTIAADPLVTSTAPGVHRQALRFGLAFREAANLRLPAATLGRFEAAAAARGLSRDALIRALLITAGSDPSLIDNILDDRT